MALPLLKVIVAALVIALASWLAGKKPEMAGFIVALPIASLLALIFSYLEHKDAEASITFAKSILVGVPISYLFFLPFFFADKLGDSFWLSYITGLILLVVGFFLHRYIMAIIG
ncbi:MAG: hypothetical protein OQK32_02425 [Gammaproteobacteria bacterium]|nr:hypothetical protein [Gammaproteobacteria bacterium]